MERRKELWQEVGRYSVGFLLSLIITLLAYMAVTNKFAAGDPLIYGLGGLAIVQAVVQLIFFLKIGREETKWRLVTFSSMLGVLLIVVVGSIWVMHHLNYNMMSMSEEQIQKKMDKESSF